MEIYARDRKYYCQKMVLGEEKMKRLVITWVLAVALFGLAGTAEAVKPVVKTEPFINVSTTPDTLDLGTCSFLGGTYDLPAALTVDVEANCMYGPIMVSVTELKRRYGGGSVPRERILVKTPLTGQFVTMAKPVFISEPATGSHKIVLDFKVQAEFSDPAGKYTGAITFTIMPPS
jgi:hypothetical protein